jgi:hypothetical protein
MFGVFHSSYLRVVVEAAVAPDWVDGNFSRLINQVSNDFPELGSEFVSWGKVSIVRNNSRKLVVDRFCCSTGSWGRVSRPKNMFLKLVERDFWASGVCWGNVFRPKNNALKEVSGEASPLLCAVGFLGSSSAAVTQVTKLTIFASGLMTLPLRSRT